MIVKTPVQGTCSCCEGKKEQLKKMQKAILDGSESENLDFREKIPVVAAEAAVMGTVMNVHVKTVKNASIEQSRAEFLLGRLCLSVLFCFLSF